MWDWVSILGMILSLILEVYISTLVVMSLSAQAITLFAGLMANWVLNSKFRFYKTLKNITISFAITQCLAFRLSNSMERVVFTVPLSAEGRVPPGAIFREKIEG